MSDDRISELIKELKELRVREAIIIASLEEANNQNIAQGATAGVAQATSTRNFPTDFVVGERVRITNQVRKPVDWCEDFVWSEQDAKRATVTKVTPDRVYFVTDNGIRTWRMPSNL
jgi:hypothetical protein